MFEGCTLGSLEVGHGRVLHFPCVGGGLGLVVHPRHGCLAAWSRALPRGLSPIPSHPPPLASTPDSLQYAAYMLKVRGEQRRSEGLLERGPGLTDWGRRV